MNAYRLYNEDVRNGLTDFDDEHFYILKNDYKKELSLILNTKSSFTPFIVARKVEFHDLNSIDWASGHYFETLDEAIKYMKGQ